MKRHRKNPDRRNAFTLMEVLLVLAILGVIAAMVVPQLIGRQKDAMIDTTKSSIHGIEKNLELYSLKHAGEFPIGEGDNVLVKFTRKFDSNDDGVLDGPYFDKYKDAWGRPLHYSWDGLKNSKYPQMEKPAIWSAGPDGTLGNEDDITNWESYAKDNNL